MRSKGLIPIFFSTEGMLMAKNKPTPRTASTSKEREWYATTGWKVFNDLLTELAASQLDVIWIENFDEVRTALANVNRKTLVQLLMLTVWIGSSKRTRMVRCICAAQNKFKMRSKILCLFFR